MAPASSRGNKKGPRVNVTRSLDDVIQDVKLLEKGLHKARDRVEKLLFELYTLEKALLETNGIRGGGGSVPRATPPDSPPPSAQNCQFGGLKTGNATVTFDGAKSVTLPEALAVLIAILANAEEDSPDELVAWKSYAQMAELLERRLRRSFDRHAISQLVLRLRDKLAEAGLDRRLVETLPKLGVRLRLKRGRAGISAG